METHSMFCEMCGEERDSSWFEADDRTVCSLCIALMWTEHYNEKREFLPVHNIDGWDQDDFNRFCDDLLNHPCPECKDRMYPAYRTALRRPLITCCCHKCNNHGIALIDENKRVRAFYREFYYNIDGSFLAEGDIPF